MATTSNIAFWDSEYLVLQGLQVRAREFSLPPAVSTGSAIAYMSGGTYDLVDGVIDPNSSTAPTFDLSYDRPVIDDLGRLYAYEGIYGAKINTSTGAVNAYRLFDTATHSLYTCNLSVARQIFAPNALLIYTSNENFLALGTSNTMRLLIDGANGNVGINNINPQSRLHIGSNTSPSNETILVQSQKNASLYLDADMDNDAGELGDAYIRLTTDGVATKSYIGLKNEAGYDLQPVADSRVKANALLHQNASAYGAIQFLTTSGDMTLTYTGLVGIGKTEPTTKLDVNGTVKATAFQGDGSGLTNLPSTGQSSQWENNDLGSNIYFLKTTGGNVGIGTNSTNVRLTIGANNTNDEKVIINSQRKAILELNGDTANVEGELGGAYIKFGTDGGGNEAYVGIAQKDDTGINGDFIAGINANALIIQHDNGFGDIQTITSGGIITNKYQGILDVRQDATGGILQFSAYKNNDVIAGTQVGKIHFGSTQTDLFGASNWVQSGAIYCEYDDLTNGKLVFAGDSDSARRMVIGANGNVGIGTNTPSQKLDVNGTVKATAFQGDGSGLTNLPSGSQWTTNGTNIYYTAGNVGIGLTNPAVALSVNGTTSTTTLRTSIYETTTGLLTVKPQTTPANTDLKIDSGGTGNRNAIYFRAKEAFRSIDSEALLRINELGNFTKTAFVSGDVGIGTTNPANKFDVLSTGVQIATFKNNLTADGSFGYITIGPQSGLGCAIGQVGYATTTNQYVFIGNLGDPVAEAGVGLTIRRGSGAVGIGITNPSHKLHVENGSVKFKVSTSGVIGTFPYFNPSALKTINTWHLATENGYVSVSGENSYMGGIAFFVGESPSIYTLVWQAGDDLNSYTKIAGSGLIAVAKGTYYYWSNPHWSPYSFEWSRCYWFPIQYN